MDMFFAMKIMGNGVQRTQSRETNSNVQIFINCLYLNCEM